MPKKKALGAFALVLSVVGGVAYGLLNGADPSPTDGISLAQGSDRVPGETPSDWVSYSDAIVVARVQSENEVTEPPAVDGDPNEGYKGRQVGITVLQTIWVNKNLPDYNAHVSPGVTIPSNITMQAMGQVSQDGGFRTASLEGAPRLEVGHTYIIPLGRFEEEGWAPTSATSVLPFDSGVIGRGEWEGNGASTLSAADFEAGSVGAAVAGRNVAVLTTLLAGTTRDPQVPAYGDPDERLESVRAANDATAEPDPLPDPSETPGDDT
ncbi:hypothetical protein [Streptomyces sp. NPDC059460]|uniref:hypothetical protein n=1 Tax=Streptomyces sp. NPDC059460 TaxID=3346840 RepID=UPI0036A03D94